MIPKIDGDVYDVSKGNSYQPGGAYNHLWVYITGVPILRFSSQKCSVGIDAARAFGTGCFQTHRTHDLRGLSETELSVSSINLIHCVSELFSVGNSTLEGILCQPQGLYQGRKGSPFPNRS